MLALDSSSLIAYLETKTGPDVDLVDQALAQKIAALPPVVLTEILSFPHRGLSVRELILGLPILELKENFWVDAAILRSKILAKGFKAKIPDTLIAQACIENETPLITRDPDFRHFAPFGLKILE